MTKKDYELIAGALRKLAAVGPVNAAASESASIALAVAFSADNPRFNRDTFLAACGVQS